ncbi:chaperonin GroEL [Streptomyces violascens]|uniref:chaperonin GroEL n=1 Tax=Streptomyces violascens TaxID=67381 RepID=UPI00365B75D2
MTIRHDEDAQRGWEHGRNRGVDAVKVSLGPEGDRVVLDAEWYERVGADLVKGWAKQTEAEADYGATTATVLAQALVREGMCYVQAGADLRGLTRGIDLAVQQVCRELASMARKPETKEELAANATQFADGDSTIGEIVVEAMGKAGQEGVIIIEESQTPAPELELTSGMRFDRGLLSPDFVDREHQETVLDNPYILLADFTISESRCLLPLLEKIRSEGKPLLVIAGEVKDKALSFLVDSHVQGRMKAAAVKAPGFGSRRTAMLGDIAALTGGTVITQDAAAQLENAGLEHLGRARKAIITKDETTLVDGAGGRETVHHRIGQIREQIKNSDSDYDREKLQDRLAKLDCGVAVIKVGAATETELMERKYLVAQALRNTKAAIEEGTVPGYGTALLQAGDIAFIKLDLQGDEQAGAAVVDRALSAPLKQIALYAGLDGKEIADKVRILPAGHGLDFRSGDCVDLRAAGIVDPVRVTRCALQNAARIASFLLTSQSQPAE